MRIWKVGDYCYHRTDTAAFFVIKKIDDCGKRALIKQIDNLQGNKSKMFNVPIDELQKDYI